MQTMTKIKADTYKTWNYLFRQSNDVALCSFNIISHFSLSGAKNGISDLDRRHVYSVPV